MHDDVGQRPLGTSLPVSELFTHILKVPPLRDMGNVAVEHLTTTLMGQIQPNSASQTEVLGSGDLQGLLITRFGRISDANTVSRLHQEDFAQALGLGLTLKYQHNGTADRSFVAKAVGTILSLTQNPGLARTRFIDITLGNLLLCNTDKAGGPERLERVLHNEIQDSLGT